MIKDPINECTLDELIDQHWPGSVFVVLRKIFVDSQTEIIKRVPLVGLRDGGGSRDGLKISVDYAQSRVAPKQGRKESKKESFRG